MDNLIDDINKSKDNRIGDDNDIKISKYNNKMANKNFKYKVIRDRGDTDPEKNSTEKMDTKNLHNMNHYKSNLVRSQRKIDKSDVNPHDDDRKREMDKHTKANNTIDKKYEAKSKNALEIKDEVNKNKDRSKARVIETKDKVTPKLNISNDKTLNTANKKPLIKTITDTDDATKKYKAVTFTEQKQQKTIEIKLPNFVNVKRTKIPKLVDKYHQNKIDNRNGEEKISKRNSKLDKKYKHKRDLASPIRNQDGGSPPTEIAKWAPNINEHKPYYEAWINTTLAAMSNKKEKMFLEKQRVFKSFKKALEQRSKSPELVYENFADERFTGRIKINHK